MDGDPLSPVDGTQQPVDRQREIRKLEGVVQVVERRMEKPFRLFGGRDPPKHQQARDNRVEPQGGHQGSCLRLVDGEVFPDERAWGGSRVHV